MSRELFTNDFWITDCGHLFISAAAHLYHKAIKNYGKNSFAFEKWKTFRIGDRKLMGELIVTLKEESR